MMRTQQKVLGFMRALEMELPHDNDPGPGIHGLTRLDFKRLRSLVDEEATEFDDWMGELQAALTLNATEDEVNHCWAEVIDAMCDLIVVIHNTSNAMNVDLEPFFNEVMRTNTAKIGGPVREDGKRLKPPGWKPPRIKEMLEEQLRKAKE